MLNDKAKKTAFNLLNKFGKNGVYIRQISEEYNVDTGEMELKKERYNVKAYIDSAKSYSSLVEKGLLTEGDNVILIASNSLPFNPKNNDLIEFPNRTYTIKYNDAVWGGEDIALHQLVGVIK